MESGVDGSFSSPEVKGLGLMTLTEKESDLTMRPKSFERSLGGGMNTTNFITLKDDGSGIFKPVSGEVSLRNGIEVGSYYKRERAAYLVSRHMGFGLVPPTVIREMDDRVGSLQEFIPDAYSAFEIDPAETADTELYKLWIFDQIVWNSDRHEGNILHKGGTVYAIDNGLTFGVSSLLPYKTFEGVKTPPEVLSILGEYKEDRHKQKYMNEQLSELLPAKEALACRARIDQLSTILIGNRLLQKNINYFPNYQKWRE